jgi:hypothetical protein
LLPQQTSKNALRHALLRLTKGLRSDSAKTPCLDAATRAYAALHPAANPSAVMTRDKADFGGIAADILNIGRFAAILRRYSFE